MYLWHLHTVASSFIQDFHDFSSSSSHLKTPESNQVKQVFTHEKHSIDKYLWHGCVWVEAQLITCVKSCTPCVLILIISLLVLNSQLDLNNSKATAAHRQIQAGWYYADDNDDNDQNLLSFDFLCCLMHATAVWQAKGKRWKDFLFCWWLLHSTWNTWWWEWWWRWWVHDDHVVMCSSNKYWAAGHKNMMINMTNQLQKASLGILFEYLDERSHLHDNNKRREKE